MISFIFATDQNGVIGKNNQLPWHLPEDLRYFKKMTMGHPIVMGRKTFQSIGKPLPGRKNIVLTRDPNFSREDCLVFHSKEEFLQNYPHEKEEIFIIGGAEIFRLFLTDVERMYITFIHHKFSGDVYFPLEHLRNWKIVSRKQGLKNEKNPYDYEFLVYEKKTEAD